MANTSVSELGEILVQNYKLCCELQNTHPCPKIVNQFKKADLNICPFLIDEKLLLCVSKAISNKISPRLIRIDGVPFRRQRGMKIL